MKPNLFQYATSELSQDAILCWLLSWSDNKHKVTDPILHELGRNFLDSLYQCANRTPPENYQSIEIYQQSGGIDIVCYVNGDTALVIEDKVGTKQHSNQLARYKATISKRGFSPDKIILVYLQTRDQSNYSEAAQHGYSVYRRRDLLKVLESSSGMAAQKENNIVADYSSHLRRIENNVQGFRTLSPKNWTWESWIGFYLELQNVFTDANWGYVPNQSGGFWGFWWQMQGDDKCRQYLQIEQAKFCFKIWVQDKGKRGALRNLWNRRILEECTRHGLKARRPNRFGNGTCMTVAILDQEYRIVNDRNELDFPRTIEILKRAESVLNHARSQGGASADS
ncbi:MAG: PD-(D/E)XK nuclease family protein [Kiritimatiellia bacterium]|jgi:hypothetical protein